MPLSQLKSTFPALRTVGRKKAAGFTFEQWHYAFCNTFTEERSRQLYERYHIPASVRVLWGSALATLEPGHQDTFVNYDNDDRAPLLFISGTHDHLMPPSVQRSNAKHYKSKTVTEVVEFDGPHLLPSRDGWEEVADYALAWAVEHAKVSGQTWSGTTQSTSDRRRSRSGHQRPLARWRWRRCLVGGGDQDGPGPGGPVQQAQVPVPPGRGPGPGSSRR